MDEKTRARIESLQSTSTEMDRSISLFGASNILIGIMVGSGVFYIGSYVFQRTANSELLAILSWVIGGIVTLISGLCFGELGAMFPRAGGTYVYLREAYGRPLAFANVISNFLIGSPASIAGVALAFVMRMQAFVPIDDFTGKIIAIVAIILFTILHYFGVRQGSRFNSALTVIKVIPIIVILFAGFILGGASPNFSTGGLLPDGSAPSLPKLFSMIAFAVVATQWAYEGWTNLNVVGEEIVEPKRNIPLAIILSVISVTILYTFFNLAIYRVLPYEEVLTRVTGGDVFLGTAVSGRVFGKIGETLVALAMVLSMLGSLNAMIMVFPRSYYAMARDGIFFSKVGTLNPKTKVPTVSLFLSSFVSIILVFLRNLDQLTSLVIFSGLILNALAFASVFVLRAKYPDINRPYKVWGYPFVPAIAILINVALAINTFIMDIQTSVISTTIIVGAVVLYYCIPNFRRGENK
ncbi:MAG: amino acid permease [Fusobacteriaceae bacterium]|jgi:APA family basic amino acid/polyamine antiporter|nr:amino acid permease [Fusobacteriaceae bacterium]